MKSYHLFVNRPRSLSGMRWIFRCVVVITLSWLRCPCTVSLVHFHRPHWLLVLNYVHDA